MTARIGVAALLFVAGAALVRPADDPLRVSDLVRFLQSGISERTILAEVAARGMAESLDVSSEAALRDAGASDELLRVVRGAAPPERPPSPPAGGPASPPGAGASERRGPVFAATARTVRLPVSVTDKKGRPVTGLRAADFQVADEGAPQPISYFSAERKPLRIAVALDVSGSMADKIEEVADALKHFHEVLEPDDELLVLAFSDQPELVQDFTSDRRRVGRVMESLRAGGGTALHDAVIEATERLASAAAESKAVVLVTDGNDTSSAASLGDAVEAARRAEVPVYSIGLGHQEAPHLLFGGLGGLGGHGGNHPGRRSRGSPGRPDFDPRPLLELSDETGGAAEILRDAQHHHAGNVDRLKEAAESIALALRHRYIIGYDAPEGGERRWRRVRVRVDRPSVRVRARKGYYAGPT